MIRVYLGNLGSGKTLSAVREIITELSGKTTYTNLMLNDVPNTVHIKPQDIILKDESGKKTELKLNIEYWKEQKKPLNVVWDEVHLTANARMSMSKPNMILGQFLAMARRITGFDESGYGHFIFIAQTESTVDKNIRDLTNEIRYYRSHWVLRCKECSQKITTHSDMRQIERCINCGSYHLKKENVMIEIKIFSSWDNYFKFHAGIKKTHDSRFRVDDPQEYYKYYDTMQIADVWQDYLKD